MCNQHISETEEQKLLRWAQESLAEFRHRLGDTRSNSAALDYLDDLIATNKIYQDCLLRASRLYAEGKPGERVFPDGAQSLAKLAEERDDLKVALADMIELIDEHGGPVLRAHATRIAKARAFIKKV